MVLRRYQIKLWRKDARPRPDFGQPDRVVRAYTVRTAVSAAVTADAAAALALAAATDATTDAPIATLIAGATL